jgi:tRNA A37 methylthiotransferase MiaB
MSAEGVVWYVRNGIVHLDDWAEKNVCISFCGVPANRYDERSDRPIPADVEVCPKCSKKARELLLLGQDNQWYRDWWEATSQ